MKVKCCNRSAISTEEQFDRDKSIQSRIDVQNAKIAARRTPPQHSEQRPSGASGLKRVRFVLPKRSDREERDVLAWELAKLGIRDPLPGSDRRRCGRCGQTLRRRGRAE